MFYHTEKEWENFIEQSVKVRVGNGTLTATSNIVPIEHKNATVPNSTEMTSGEPGGIQLIYKELLVNINAMN